MAEADLVPHSIVAAPDLLEDAAAATPLDTAKVGLGLPGVAGAAPDLNSWTFIAGMSLL